MASILHLAGADLAALIRRGLGERVQEVRCAIAPGELRFTLDKLDVSGWLPRMGLEIAVVPIFDAERQELRLHWKIVPSSLVGILAVPVQHLGMGTKVVDALVERLGWREAVISRGDDAIVFALQRLEPLRRLGIRVQALAITDMMQLNVSIHQD